MRRAIGILVCLLAPLALPAPTPELKLMSGTSTVIDCAADIERISTGSPDVADAVSVSRREVLVQAKTPGLASIIVWSKGGGRTLYEIDVEQNLEPLRKLVEQTFPNEKIQVQGAHDSLSLTGLVSSQTVADRATALVAPWAKVVVNNLERSEAEKQILLRVKFAELDRTAADSFGVNLVSAGAANTIGGTTTGQFAAPSLTQLTGSMGAHIGGTTSTFSISNALNIFAFRPDLNLGAFISALETQGLMKILAQPNLVASNGKEASFLVGGEFPIPIVQGGPNVGAVTIQFKEFGIRLTFLPALTERNTIKLHVKPEVSSIDITNSVNLAGYTIPGLSTRRIDTEIELGEGQSFVIGGLLDDRVTQSLSQIPGLARLPVLGELFKSRQVNRSKTELIVMVTPEFTRPLNPDEPKPELKEASGPLK
jgi:pilus assembly protein CpaC